MVFKCVLQARVSCLFVWRPFRRFHEFTVANSRTHVLGTMVPPRARRIPGDKRNGCIAPDRLRAAAARREEVGDMASR